MVPDTIYYLDIFDILIYACYIFSHMESDTISEAELGSEPEVMAAVEDGQVETFVLADVSRDEAYLTVPLTEATSLSAWR
jgi:hypothetical protein